MHILTSVEHIVKTQKECKNCMYIVCSNAEEIG